MDFEKLLEEAAGKKLAGKKKQLQSSYDQSLADLAELEQGASGSGPGPGPAAGAGPAGERL